MDVYPGTCRIWVNHVKMHIFFCFIYSLSFLCNWKPCSSRWSVHKYAVTHLRLASPEVTAATGLSHFLPVFVLEGMERFAMFKIQGQHSPSEHFSQCILKHRLHMPLYAQYFKNSSNLDANQPHSYILRICLVSDGYLVQPNRAIQNWDCLPSTPSARSSSPLLFLLIGFTENKAICFTIQYLKVWNSEVISHALGSVDQLTC